MKDFWDERYKEEGYAYGTEPNAFFKSALDGIPEKGKILFPGEGEGRNAVFAATKGWDVYAFDISQQGKNKALKLAQDNKVSIHYEVGDFFTLNVMNLKYDAAALIFAHFPPTVNTIYHRAITNLIKPGGFIFLEGYSKAHLEMQKLNPQAGGPKNEEMLYSLDQIQRDFSAFEPILLEETEANFQEGKYHIGRGKVIRFIGKKKE